MAEIRDAKFKFLIDGEDVLFRSQLMKPSLTTFKTALFNYSLKLTHFCMILDNFWRSISEISFNFSLNTSSEKSVPFMFTGISALGVSGWIPSTSTKISTDSQ